MALSNDLASLFAKEIVKSSQPVQKTNEVLHGTIVNDSGNLYVKIDGSDLLTPVTTTTSIKNGERVTVTIKDHSALITGNISSPSASQGSVDDLGDQIAEFDTIIADVVHTDDLTAIYASIEHLTAQDVTITGELDAAKAEIDDLTAKDVEITGQLTAANANIDKLEAEKADIAVLEAEYATIENLEATNADIHNLEADYGSFKNLNAENLSALQASIEDLDVTKLDAESADLMYADIDFANIGSAAVEELFAKSGIIGDLVMSEGHVTGTLVGVTIKGDLIEGGTVVADKLVMKGDDGLFYKLNTDGVSITAQQTEYNSLNGSIITAQSVTAEKIAVDDLVAFNATIGGYHITDTSLYSGVKTSATNTTRGTFMNDEGEFAIGDMDNYLRFFQDTDGTWKLEINASEIKMGTSNTSKPLLIDQESQFYQSDSPTSLTGGSWSTTQPTWVEGKYIWMRYLNTYSDESTGYSPDETGVCITGNSGADGAPGEKGDPGAPGKDGAPGEDGKDGTSVTIVSTSVTYQASTSGTTVPTGSWTTSVPSVAAGQYLWTKTVVNYSSGTSTTSYSVGRMGQNGAQGAPGAAGEDGNGIKTTTVTYQASSSQTVTPTGTWTSTVPVLTVSLPYLWTRTVWTYDDGSSTTSYSVSSTIDGIEVGGRNLLIGSATVTGDCSTNSSIVEDISWNGNTAVLTHSAWKGIYMNLSGPCERNSVQVGDTLTASIRVMFDFTPKKATKFTLYRANVAGATASTTYAVEDIPLNKWFTVSFTFDATEYTLETDSDIDPRIEADYYENDDYSFNGHIYFSSPKVELGNKATDWTPAPEDVSQDILSTSAEQAQAVFDVGKDTIMAQVSQTYYTIDEATGLAQQVEAAQTSITQTANAIDLKFESYVIQDEFDEVTGTLTDKMDVIDKYIRFVDGDIILGEDGNPVTLKIENDRIAFSENNNEVMYINNEVLNINNAEIKNRLTIANFAFVPRASGNMSIVYTG